MPAHVHGINDHWQCSETHRHIVEEHSHYISSLNEKHEQQEIIHIEEGLIKMQLVEQRKTDTTIWELIILINNFTLEAGEHVHEFEKQIMRYLSQKEQN